MRITLARCEPQLVRMKPQHVAADLPEPVDIGFARRAPIDEVDPQLEGRLALADQLQGIDPGQRHQVADVRDRRFADADDADLLRLYQPDLDLSEPLRQDS